LKNRVKLDGEDGGIGIDRIVESVEGGEARRKIDRMDKDNKIRTLW
jgi:hypothetical protein